MIVLKRGFGPNREKDYFVVLKDGDTFGRIVAGPFPTEAECQREREALRPLYFQILGIQSGHLADV